MTYGVIVSRSPPKIQSRIALTPSSTTLPAAWVT